MSTEAARIPNLNNLDLLRLLFACEVLFGHLVWHLDLPVDRSFFLHFPGVPAFFFTSGFLVYASLENSSSLWSFYRNRFLRLFPALFVVALGGLGLAVIAKGSSVPIQSYLGWFIAQISLGQAWNPPWLRDVGVGTMNGSLWTITAEILFYFMLPLIAAMNRRNTWALPLAFCLSFAFFWLGPIYSGQPIALGKTLYDYLGLTPIVWGWMFLAGSLAYLHLNKLLAVLPHLWLAAPAMALMIYLGHDNILLQSSGSRLGLVYYLLYCALICYVAFALPVLKLPVDISYGIYIWHMLVINTVLFLGYKNWMLAALATFIMALLSAWLIERPALALKKQTLRSKALPVRAMT